MKVQMKIMKQEGKERDKVKNILKVESTKPDKWLL